jgi:hypothetical protein
MQRSNGSMEIRVVMSNKYDVDLILELNTCLADIEFRIVLADSDYT